MKKWECVVCGFIYDEEEGLPEEGIEPGTKWEDVPRTGCARTAAWARKISR
ncbi:Rubredoxin-2 [Alcanivorax sp. ALC70]|nr:Rubredoxin-2 [Alcanivorax sp. ALC70]